MSAEIINLRKARKQKARQQKDRAAEENRLKYGRTLADRRHQDATKERDKKHLDGIYRKITDEPTSE